MAKIAPGHEFFWTVDGIRHFGVVMYQIEVALPWNGKRPRTKLIDNYRVKIAGSAIEYLRAAQIRKGR